MSHLVAHPPRERSQDTASVELPGVSSNAEIRARLEREREEMLWVVNFLEALCAKLARSNKSGQPLSIVATSTPTNAAQTARINPSRSR